MKKLKFLLAFTLLFSANLLFAQNARFTTSGVITFEKRVNMYATLRKQINKVNETYMKPMFEEYQKKNPQFKSLKSTLTFTNGNTLFTPIAEETSTNSWWGDSPGVSQNNIILTNTLDGFGTSQKKVYEEIYLVKDSTRKINWKITTEMRTIAGYNCRRANALVMDSIYVVAFYTDEIPVSGGPESFTGLPGMILGVALPHENITWFATNVTDTPIGDDKLKAPTKGKVVNKLQLFTTLKAALKKWGNDANDALKAFML